MASTVSWDALRGLAAFRAASGIALSFYLNLDPGLTSTAVDAQTRVNSLLSEAAKQLDREDLTHDQRRGLKADLERIRRYFQQELVRDRAHGLAVFADERDGLWQPLTLAESVADAVRVDAELHLTPLIPLVGRGEGVLIAVVGRERGDLYRLREGRLEPVVDRSEEQPGQHDQGGWSQANFQRHIEQLVVEHLQRVASELDRLAGGRSEQIVVVSSENTRTAFENLLSRRVQDAIVGWTTAEAHAGPTELLAAATPALEMWRAAEEQRTIDRWREEASRNGRATTGWEQTLEAANDGRVDLLLYRDGLEHAAWRCPSCGRLAAEEGTCPLDGTPLGQAEDGVGLAVRQTISNGGTVCALTSRGDLDPVEGIGALLRY